MSAHMTPEQVRSKIDHPIVDGDGHWVEYDPVFSDKMRKVGGDLAADGFLKAMGTTRELLSMSVAERREKRIGQQAFWARQAENTLDRATAMMPKLLYDRLDELGLDFVDRLPDRRAALAAHPGRRDPARRDPRLQHRLGRLFQRSRRPDDPGGDHPDAHPGRGDRRARIRHQATGLEGRHVRQQHGAKGAGGRGQRPRHRALCGVVRRARPRQRLRLRPGLGEMRRIGHRADLPQRQSSNQGLRLSPTNFTYNHIGHFAAAGHATAKAIFLGGVTRRFPELRFAFLEGGVGWASQLFGDLIEHWERRSAKALERMHPDKLDRAKLMSLVEKYGYDDIAAALRERGGLPDPEQAYLTGDLENIDDFSACKITRKEDWVDLYAKPYYFGCEADDRMNATAFGRNNPFGSKLNAIFSSDIGHFDVIDMRDPLPEAYELVEDGHITADNFRDFTFANAVKLWGTQNPRFFEGTRVAKEAAAVLAAAQTPTLAAAE